MPYRTDHSIKRTALSIAEAAAIAGRSISWVRMQRDFGPLEPAIVEGRQAVTADSLFAAISASERQRCSRAPKRREPGVLDHPRLRLVVDNTK